MDDGRSVEIVMTSCSSAGRREQECMILLVSVVRDPNLADGSAGAIRGRSIQVVMLVPYLLMWDH